MPVRAHQVMALSQEIHGIHQRDTGVDMFADDTVFKKIDELNIELYTDVKDPETETQIEDILIAHDLPYEKSEVWIESEKLYEVLYQTQIIGG